NWLEYRTVDPVVAGSSPVALAKTQRAAGQGLAASAILGSTGPFSGFGNKLVTPAGWRCGGVATSSASMRMPAVALSRPFPVFFATPCQTGLAVTFFEIERSLTGKATPGARAVGTAGAVVSGLLLVVAAASFGVYHWVALGGWAAVGLALWLARRPAATG